jgi:hypothetical protein
VIIPGKDPFLSAASAIKAAARVGAKTVALDGFGHWWMLQDPARAATILREFWTTPGLTPPAPERALLGADR